MSCPGTKRANRTRAEAPSNPRRTPCRFCYIPRQYDFFGFRLHQGGPNFVNTGVSELSSSNPPAAAGPRWRWVYDSESKSNLRELTERWSSWPGHAEAEVFKQNALRTVLALPADGPRPAVVIKRYDVRSRSERLKYLFVPSRARAEWLALQHLAEYGIAVPRVLAYGEQRQRGLLLRAGLVMERVFDVASLADWLGGSATGEERGAVLEELGATIARLHEARCRHSDLHAGNVLVREQPDDKGRRLVFIDHHVCKIGDVPSESTRRANLAKLLHSIGPLLRGGEVVELVRAYQHRRGAAEGSRLEAMVRDLEQRADRLEQIRLGSRSRRCWKNSSEFAREKVGAWSVFRRREIERDQLQPVWDQRYELDPIFKERRGQTVGATRLGEHAVVLKHRRYSFWRGLAYCCVRGPLEQSWGAARSLDVRGIETPRALALLVRKTAGIPREAVLVTERIEPSTPLWSDVFDRYYPPSGRSREGLVERVPGFANWIRKLHDTGIYHRDLNPQNILVTGEPGEEERFLLIDLDSITAGRRLTQRRRRKNLVQLGLFPEGHISPRDRLRFLAAYDRGDGRFYNPDWIRALDSEWSDEVVGLVGRMSQRERATVRAKE